MASIGGAAPSDPRPEASGREAGSPGAGGARPVGGSAGATPATPVPTDEHPLAQDQWICPICQELAWKPCVNACGHVFCFWCLHQAMDPLKPSACPLCRSQFRHLPTVCEPLQHFIELSFPAEAEERRAEMAEVEAQVAVRTPVVPAAPPRRLHGGLLPGGDILHEGIQPAACGPWAPPAGLFRCASCGELPRPPCVPACGHLVCEPCRQRVCRRPGCGQPTRGGGAVCAALDGLLRSAFPLEYAAPRTAAQPLADSTESLEGLQAAAVGSGHRYVRGYLPQGFDHAPPQRMLLADALELSNSTPEIAGISWKGSINTQTEWKVWIKGAGCEPRVEEQPGWHTFIKMSKLPVEALCNLSSRPYVHYEVGCDACGQLPITGARFSCEECPDYTGYDLCGVCYAAGFHTNASAGRFDQAHLPSHRMREVPPVPSPLHLLQEARPDLTPDQIIEFARLSGMGAREQMERDAMAGEEPEGES